MSMSPRGVLQVSAYYPPHLGGQEIAVRDLAFQLARKGEQVEVVTSDLGAHAGVTIEDGVRVTRLRSSEYSHTAILWGLFYWLLRRARRATPVHVHVGQVFTPETVWLAAKIKRFKYIVHLHAQLVPSGPLGRCLAVYKKAVLSRVIKGAAAIIVLNDEQRALVAHDYDAASKILVFPNGIDESYFTTDRAPGNSDVINLLFVGRLSPHKNIAALIEAVSQLPLPVSLDIVGDGECRDELQQLVDSKSLQNVRLHGTLRRDEIRRFYATCTAVILPSLFEVHPLVLLEATASRAPVIVTRAIGLAVGLHNASILIEPTVPGIIAGIETFARMPPEARDHMTDGAMRSTARLAWPQLTRRYLALYSHLRTASPDGSDAGR